MVIGLDGPGWRRTALSENRSLKSCVVRQLSKRMKYERKWRICLEKGGCAPLSECLLPVPIFSSNFGDLENRFSQREKLNFPNPEDWQKQMINGK